MISFLEALAWGAVYPRITADGEMALGFDPRSDLHADGLHPEARDYVQSNRGPILAELVAWAVSGTPPSPACCPEGVPPQGPLGRVPAALLEGAEAALATLDGSTQDALALAVLRGAGCEASIEGAEVVLRGPTPDVHGFVAEHAEALGLAVLREHRSHLAVAGPTGDRPPSAAASVLDVL